MKKNLGKIDRTIRAILGLVFFILGFAYFNGITMIIFYILSAILFATSLIGYCPLSKLLGIDTTGRKKAKKRK